MKDKKIGILGGGQLGRMLLEQASAMGVECLSLDAKESPCSSFANFVVGDYKSAADVQAFSGKVDALTVEIEHVNASVLHEIDSRNGVSNEVIAADGASISGIATGNAAATATAISSGLLILPKPLILKLLQDKFTQKEFLQQKQLPLGPFTPVTNKDECLDAGARFGYPFMLKSRLLAYDGRGNYKVDSPGDIPAALEFLSNNGNKLYAEKWVPFVKELAVMVARAQDGSIVTYPCVETVQKNNICHLVIAPAQIDGLLCEKARQVAEQIVRALDSPGVYGIELFLTAEGDILVNEIAPRPHNSGHYTIEACYTSQYEQLLRCLLGQPLGKPDMKVPASAMVNLLGEADGQEGMDKLVAKVSIALGLPGASVHLYGKKHCRKGRKMAHVTIVGEAMQDVLTHASKLAEFSIPLRPVVGVIMGSDSDLPTVKPACAMLQSFNVPFEVDFVSAHRTPGRMVEYAKTAHERGIQVIIAAAGGAAHLPGMVACQTPLPVIGIPVALKYLDGVDSLHSIAQMPRGVPVATVAINNAVNAALLAIRILGASSPFYRQKLQEYTESQANQVKEKVERVKSIGWDKY